MQPTNMADPTMTSSNFPVFIALYSIEPAFSSKSAVSIARCRRRSGRQDARCSLFARARPFLDHVKDAGHKENSNRAGGEHSADYRRPHNLAGHRTSAARRPQWHAAEDKCERCHQNRAQPQPRPFKSRIRKRLSVFVLILGELDDQDGVFRRQTDQHDQADLGVDVAFDLHHIGRQKNAEQSAAQPKHRKSSEARYRRAEQYAERQRPAFVKSRKNQEYEQQRQSKDHRGRHSLSRFLLQKRNSGVVESHLSRHGLFENIFEGCAGLIGAETRCGASVDLGATILVKAHGEFGAKLRFDRGERRERNVFAVAVADIESSDVVRAGAIVAFGLDVNLPLPTESVEVVDEIATHKGLDGAVDIAKIDTLFQHFVAIHIDEFLWNAGQKSGAQAGDLRPLSSSFKKRAHIFREKLNVAAGAVFEDEGEPAGGANTRDS